MFIYSGVPVAPVVPGSSFTIGINVVITTGGTFNELQGLSYWFAQSSPAGGPFPFAITNRAATGLFGGYLSDLVYPQVMDPINRNPNGTTTSTDLGAKYDNAAQPSGTYFIVHMTFSVASNIAPGIYTLGNTTSSTPGVGDRTSVVFDAKGDTFPIAASSFNITVVPEPGSIALLCVGLLSVGALAYRRRVAAR